MKKQIILAGLLIAIVNLSFGQTPSWQYNPGNYINNSSGGLSLGSSSAPLDVLHVRSGYNGGAIITQTGWGGSNLMLENATSGGRKFVLTSTGVGNAQGAGHFSIYDFTAGADRLFINSSGNVGIGTISPLDKLQVDGGLRIQKNGSDAISTQLYIGNAASANNRGFNFQLNATGSSLGLWAYDFHYGIWNRKFDFTKDGTFGIGTGPNAPEAYLHIVTPNNTTGAGLIVNHGCTSAYSYGSQVNVNNDLTKAFTVHKMNGNTAVVKFQVWGNGKTQIGEKAPPTAHQDAFLSVDGKVICRDLYVLSPTIWPDYVFSNEYKLLDLNYVKEYYTVNKHLPGVPNACDVQENGINLGEMSKIQMQKIEELTIYMVQLKEEVEQLKKENEMLKGKIK